MTPIRVETLRLLTQRLECKATAIDQLRDACRAAMHLCRCMDGRRDLPTDAQIREVGDACEAAMKNTEGC